MQLSNSDYFQLFLFWFASLHSASRCAVFKISLVVESGVFQNKHTNKITWGLYNKVPQDFFDALEIGLSVIQ